MTSQEVYGESDWNNQGNKPQQNQGLQKDQWMKLQEGDNRIRVISNPYAYMIHSLPGLATDPRKPPRIKCSDPVGSARSRAYKKEDRIPLSEVKCPVCRMAGNVDTKEANAEAFKKGYIPKKRWYLGIIDRKAKQARCLDIGPQIQKAIQNFVQDDEIGAPIKYDISIKVNKAAPKNEYYSIINRTPTPLSEEDLRLKEEFDLSKIAALCAPPSEERTMKQLKFAMEQFEKVQSVSETKSEKSDKETKAPQAGSTDEEFEFPEEN